MMIGNFIQFLSCDNAAVR